MPEKSLNLLPQGTSEAIRGSAQALATVSAIIDGSGSIGATLGPYITSVLTNKRVGSLF